MSRHSAGISMGFQAQCGDSAATSKSPPAVLQDRMGKKMSGGFSVGALKNILGCRKIKGGEETVGGKSVSSLDTPL